MASSPKVFISYSHKDEKWKDLVVSQLGVLQNDRQLDVWDDRRIAAGNDWEPEIEAALKQASAAVLLISANFLNSRFILGKEVPLLLQRRASEGLPVIPVIISTCPWSKVSWLNPIQCRPKDGKALASFTGDKRNQELSKIAIEISELINQPSNNTAPQSAISNLQSAIVRLTLPPPLTPHLFGRDDELRLLDEAWANPSTNLVVFHALGGAGKSALVSKWLAQMAAKNYDGARRVFGWSFFSQGSSENRSDSSEAFIDSALAFFGVTVEGDYFRKADRLAEALRAERTILILDGVEPLQYPPNSAGLPEGGLKDRALQTILTQLAAQQPGLCVITSRERLSDLNGYDEATVIQRALDRMPYATATGEQPCAQLLRALGATGDDDEMLAAAQEFQGHAYGLTLLGSYVAEVLGGDLRRRKDIANLFDDDRFGSQADRMIAAYETWLGDGVEVAIMRLLGLFDRPAEAASIAALREAPAIAGLTETLQGLGDVKWQQALSRLRRIYLLSTASASGEIDAHPLAREHFGQQLRQRLPAAWREANNRLYEHLCATTPDISDATLDDLQPLLQAVTHGCRAGLFGEALDDVYWKRIERGKEGYCSRHLGCCGSTLGVLAPFFDPPWEKIANELSKAQKADVLGQAGFKLQALGRLPEAEKVLLDAVNAYEDTNNPEEAAFNAARLSEVSLYLGKISEAIQHAQRGVEFANWAGEPFVKAQTLSKLANALHQSGRFHKSRRFFVEVEQLVKSWPPHKQRNYTMARFLFCDLLLSINKHEEATNCSETMANLSPTISRDKAFMHSACGLVQLSKAPKSKADIQMAREYLQTALDCFRDANLRDELPRALLIRARLRFFTGEWTGPESAQADLAEARAIAERGEMRLHLTDYHLESARLALALHDAAQARAHSDAARKLIDATGYHRRDGELQAIADALESRKVI